MVVIDPGPDVEDHVRVLASRMETADHATILLTHGHRDHAGAAAALARLTGAPVHGPEGLDAYGVERVDTIEVVWSDGTEERFPGGAVDRLVELSRGGSAP